MSQDSSRRSKKAKKPEVKNWSGLPADVPIAKSVASELGKVMPSGDGPIECGFTAGCIFSSPSVYWAAIFL